MSPSNTTTSGAGNSTTNGSHWIGGSGNVSTGDSGGGGLLGGFAPSGWDMLENAIRGLVQSFANGVASLLDMFNRSLLTLPAAGDAMRPATWVSIDDPFWIAAFTVYAMLSAFILPLIWGVGFFNVGYNRKVSRRDRVKKLMWALFLIIAGWELLMFWFHFWNEAALAFAPSGKEFLSTPGNISKLGVGVILGGGLILWQTSVVLIGLGIHLMFVLLTFLFVAMWPLSVGLYVSDMFVTEAIGTSGIMATLVLAPLQFVKALVLRIIFEFPLKLNNPETAVTFILIAIGVTIAFVGIPWYGLKRLLPRSIVATGGRLGQKGKGKNVGDYSDRVPSGSELREKTVTVASEGKSRLSERASALGSSTRSRARDTYSSTRDSFSNRSWSSRGSNSTDTRSRRGSTRRGARSSRSREWDYTAPSNRVDGD